MAATPEVRAPQAGIQAVTRQAARDVRVPQSATLAVYNIPADRIDASNSLVMIPYTRISQSLRVEQARAVAVVSGRIDTPKLQAWYYTLDGHDMYVLRLGTYGKTLVYDLSTGQWSWFTSEDSVRWRASCGTNWRAAQGIGSAYGSNIVVGDDSSGTLWVLDPEKGMDDKMQGNNQVPFERIATGQLPITARQAAPIYSVNLSASFGKPDNLGNTVTLSYSDDQGNTYVTADEPMVSNEGGYDQEFTWRSLGQVRSPGRLFRITDDGAFARIDSLSVNE